MVVRCFVCVGVYAGWFPSRTLCFYRVVLDFLVSVLEVGRVADQCVAGGSRRGADVALVSMGLSSMFFASRRSVSTLEGSYRLEGMGGSFCRM